MGERTTHPARDKNELRAELRLRIFEMLLSQEYASSDAAEKAKSIANDFTDDYDT